jgi:hypothetical protein
MGLNLHPQSSPSIVNRDTLRAKRYTQSPICHTLSPLRYLLPAFLPQSQKLLNGTNIS